MTLPSTLETVRRRARHSLGRYAMVALSFAGVAGCKDLSGTQPLSAGSADPAAYNTPEGVQLQADGVRGLLRAAFNRFLLGSGLLTDELTWADNRAGNMVDARQLPEGIGDVTGTYDSLQNLRVAAAVAIENAHQYAPNLPPAQLGELFATQGYAEVMLADLFCSGVPLSLPRAAGDIDYRAGSSTKNIYQHAITLFDSALTLSTDSLRMLTLARVGRGRAWLALGQYDSAARAVSAVHDGDQYELKAVVGDQQIRVDNQVTNQDFRLYSASDIEGTVGLAYRSSQDPRTQSMAIEYGGAGNPGEVGYVPATPSFYPLKYSQAAGDSTTIVIAGSVEARLIEAEVALRHGDTDRWLTILNALRTSGQSLHDVFDIQPRIDPITGGFVVDPVTGGFVFDTTYVRTDTTWAAGIGGVAGLDTVTDPGSTTARVDLLFAERAAWLYLTGHRQGDLRRLVRSGAVGGYGRPARQVYPSGTYNFTLGAYGSDVTVPVPQAERSNPQFQGCLNHDA